MEKPAIAIRLTLRRDYVQTHIPYMIICEAHEGARWNTMTRKRRWKSEFTERERAAANKLFQKARQWALGKGVPDTVRMSPETLELWSRLGSFCASL